MADPLIRKCRKEAAWNTVKELTYVIGKAFGIGTVIALGICLLLAGMIYLIEFTKGYDFTFLVFIVRTMIVILFFGTIAAMCGWVVYEVYSDNLKACIERIKSENLMKSLSKPSALDIAKKEGLVESDE